jgi:hypothetical protein
VARAIWRVWRRVTLVAPKAGAEGTLTRQPIKATALSMLRGIRREAREAVRTMPNLGSGHESALGVRLVRTDGQLRSRAA